MSDIISHVGTPRHTDAGTFFAIFDTSEKNNKENVASIFEALGGKTPENIALLALGSEQQLSHKLSTMMQDGNTLALHSPKGVRHILDLIHNINIFDISNGYLSEQDACEAIEYAMTGGSYPLAAKIIAENNTDNAVINESYLSYDNNVFVQATQGRIQRDIPVESLDTCPDDATNTAAMAMFKTSARRTTKHIFPNLSHQKSNKLENKIVFVKRAIALANQHGKPNIAKAFLQDLLKLESQLDLQNAKEMKAVLRTISDADVDAAFENLQTPPDPGMKDTALLDPEDVFKKAA